MQSDDGTTPKIRGRAPAAADPNNKVPPPPLRKGDRLSVLWTDMDRWFDGAFQWSIVEPGDDGPQRTSCILYDKCPGEWDAHYGYHCLDVEHWERLA